MNSRSFDTLRRVSYGRFTMIHFTQLKQLAERPLVKRARPCSLNWIPWRSMARYPTYLLPPRCSPLQDWSLVLPSPARVSTAGGMVKHGSSYLRYAILRCRDAVMLNNEVFAQYYSKKIAEGKPYNVAKTHLAKKLIRVIYTMETIGTKLDPDKLR